MCDFGYLVVRDVRVRDGYMAYMVIKYGAQLEFTEVFSGNGGGSWC